MRKEDAYNLVTVEYVLNSIRVVSSNITDIRTFYRGPPSPLFFFATLACGGAVHSCRVIGCTQKNKTDMRISGLIRDKCGSDTIRSGSCQHSTRATQAVRVAVLPTPLG